MILSFKGRPVPKPGDKVKAYRRLSGPNHKVVKWSLLDPRTSLVVGRADEVLLRDVTFQVRESGRQKVLATGRKNVHAFAVGTLCRRLAFIAPPSAEVFYNPSRSGSFTSHTGESVDSAKEALLDSQGKMWCRWP